MSQSRFEKIIAKDFENRLERGLKAAADAISLEIELRYEKVMGEEGVYEIPNSFYNSYIPHAYKRTYYSLLGSDGYDNPFANTIVDLSTRSAIGGIGVSSDNIPGEPYKAQKDWVFERTFVHGIHGYTHSEATEWSKRDSNVRKNIHFRFTGRSMEPLDPPPAEQMETNVKNIAKTGTLPLTKTTINNEFTKAFIFG